VPKLHILVLSPHRGDAAISLAQTIATWLAAGHAVTILNIFTRSLEAPFSDADSVHPNDRLAYVSAMRRREDEAFHRHIPRATLLDLNIKDAPLRLHIDPETVDQHPLDPTDGAFPKIQKALTKHITPNTALVIPLALNPHIDHRVTHQAALTFTATHPHALYEDKTDAPNPTPDPSLHLITTQPNLTWKRKLLLTYASQLDTPEATTHAETPERLWATESFLTLTNAPTTA
jgi:LmbE family N-acetylglucosaminyl deacetylase